MLKVKKSEISQIEGIMLKVKISHYAKSEKK